MSGRPKSRLSEQIFRGNTWSVCGAMPLGGVVAGRGRLDRAEVQIPVPARFVVVGLVSIAATAAFGIVFALVLPGVGYNLVDLGLVYDVAIDDGGVVHVVMTTITPGCPATNYLKNGAGEAASDIGLRAGTYGTDPSGSGDARTSSSIGPPL